MDTKKPKVAFLSFYNGEVYRGVETYVFELCNILADLGIDITVYQNGPKLKNSRYKTISTNLPIDWTQKGIEGRFLGIPFTDYYARLVGKFTRKALNLVDKDTDVIVSNNGSLQVLYCRVWSFIKGVKHIAVGQSGPGADDKWNLLCFPDVFMTLTSFQKDWAHKFNPFVKVEKIPNGVDLKKFNSRTKHLKIDLPHPIILSVGALEPGKRLDLIIKAVSKTRSSLLLVGKGMQEKDLLKLGNDVMPGRLKIISLPFLDMPKVYTACDLFTYPTVPWESFGIVLLEAMASNLPIVATDDPIRKEIVGDAGLFVDPTDIQKYSEVLDKALKIKWDTKPRKQAEKYSWDEVAIKYKELFNNL